MNINDPVDFDALNAAIVAGIAGAFPTFQTVEFYRADRDKLPVPAILLEMGELETADNDPGTGQIAFVARFEARIVLAFDTPNVEQEIRKIAASLAAFLNLRRWPGVITDPAQVIGCYADDFAPELDRFEVWRVEWSHQFNVGASVWVDSGITPTTVYLGFEPKVGSGNEGNYFQISPPL